MKPITPAELAKHISATTGQPFTRQAVHHAITGGTIPTVTHRSRRMVDLDDPAVQTYIGHATRQREHGKDPSEKPAAKPAKKTRPSKVGQYDDPDINLNAFTIKLRTMLAEMRKKEAQAKILEKNYLPRTFIEHGLFRYITRLNTTLERSAAVFIEEVGHKILEASEVTPEHIQAFITLVLQAIDDTKTGIRREIDTYDPEG